MKASRELREAIALTIAQVNGSSTCIAGMKATGEQLADAEAGHPAVVTKSNDWVCAVCFTLRNWLTLEPASGAVRA